MAGERLEETNQEFDVNDPGTWLKEVILEDGTVVNVPVMLLTAEE